MISFIKLTSLLLLLAIAASDVKAVDGKGFSVLSQNLTVVYNALERIQWNTHKNLVEDVILVNNPNPNFDDQKLIEVTYYLYTAKQNVFNRFYPSERITLLETLEQMPLSTLNLITKPTICFENWLSDEYLATYLDVDASLIRIVTTNYKDDRTLKWHVSGNKTTLNLNITSEAFVVPQFENFLWLDKRTQNDEIVSIQIDIGMSGKDNQRSGVWKMTPIGNYVSIYNYGTNQYITATNQNYTYGYHVARADKLYLPSNKAYLWKAAEC